VKVQSSYDEAKYPKENINDGRFNKSINSQRWLSSASESPIYVELSWDKVQTIGAMRVISGWFGYQAADDPISDFRLQVEVARRFSAVTSDRIRLVVTKTPGNIARIWEVELYHPAAASK